MIKLGKILTLCITMPLILAVLFGPLGFIVGLIIGVGLSLPNLEKGE